MSFDTISESDGDTICAECGEDIEEYAAMYLCVSSVGASDESSKYM